MQQLMRDIEEVVDLSASETKELIEVFKRFVERHFDIDPVVLHQTFTYPANRFLNQQEDEDNYHAEMDDLVYY